MNGSIDTCRSIGLRQGKEMGIEADVPGLALADRNCCLRDGPLVFHSPFIIPHNVP